jgi:hypothetical protein
VGYPNTAQSRTITSVVSGGTGPYTYSWSGSNISRLSDATSANPVYTPTANGMACYTDCYTLTVTDANGCTRVSNQVCVNVSFANAGDNGDMSCPLNTKVSICHFPGGNPGNMQTICVGISAIPAHTFGLTGPNTASNQHGNDCIGGCYQTACGTVPRNNSASEALLSEDLGSGNILENYPDPFKEMTTIRFVMATDTHVTMEVYDLTGKLVKVGFNGNVHAQQEVKVEINGSDLNSGLYIYKLVTPEGVTSGKMMLMKD